MKKWIRGLLIALGISQASAASPPSQALIVHLKLSQDGFGTQQERERFFQLSDHLEKAVLTAGAGEYDGNEVGGGEFVMYFYGPAAERLAELVIPALRKTAPDVIGFARIRSGIPGAPERRIELRQ